MRFYDPQLGQFTQPGSIVAGSGNAVAWNRYAYVHNSRVNYTDSSGHFLDTLFDAIELALDAAGCLSGSPWDCAFLTYDLVALEVPGLPASYGSSLTCPSGTPGGPCRYGEDIRPMTIFHTGPVPQPERLFTLSEYRQLVEREKQILDGPGLQFDGPISQELDALWVEYYARLPVYLLARCPICGGRVWEGVDTYSLNGRGWDTLGPSGYGWARGSGSDTRPGYQAECGHVRIVAHCVNLNGLVADDVFRRDLELGPEVPYVMLEPISAEKTYMVIHALPVGRYDEPEPQPRYAVYFMSYFTDDISSFRAAISLWSGERGLIFYNRVDFDLVKWVKAGKVFWLDPNDPDLPLRNEPVEAFPYADIQGDRYPWRKILAGGKIETDPRWSRSQRPSLRRRLGQWLFRRKR